MSRGWVVVLVGCSGTVPSAHAGMHVVLVAAGASPAAPLAPRSAPSLEALSGKGLGDGVSQGVLGY